MRVSQKQLQTVVGNLNYYTQHKASVMFTAGCGVYLTIDGEEYKHKRKDGTHEGISNKEAYEILKQYDKEVEEGCNRKAGNT